MKHLLTLTSLGLLLASCAEPPVNKPIQVEVKKQHTIPTPIISKVPVTPNPTSPT